MSGRRSLSAGDSSLTWLAFLTLSGLLVMGAISLIRPMTTYKLLALEVSGVTVGVVSAVYALAPLVCVVPVGRFAQRALSLKPLLLVGALTIAAGAGIIAGGGSLAVVILGTAVVGFGQLIFVIAGQAMVARFASNRQLDMAFGWFTAGFSAGQMLGPLAGGAFLSGAAAGDPRAASDAIDLSLWTGAIASACVLVVLLIAGQSFAPKAPGGQTPVKKKSSAAETEAEKRTRAVRQPDKPSTRRILRAPGMTSYMLASVALLSMMDILMAFLPLVGEAADVSPFWVGVLLAVRAAASILSRAVLSHLRRLASRGALVLLALWIPGISLAVLPMTIQILWLAVVLMAFAGFFLGIGQPLTMTQVTQAVPAQWRSSALAVRLMGNRLGQVFVPLAAGGVVGLWGPGAAIWLACGLLISSGSEQLLARHRRSD